MKNKILDYLIENQGTPVELTESSPEVTEARTILKEEGEYNNHDFGGSVYWSPDEAIAIVLFNPVKSPSTIK